ncbi:MAG: hypothetical protein MI861_03315, partial [Pirellulales bacterium]|nr:hypothetical protein [Pirellulales bacterium]
KLLGDTVTKIYPAPLARVSERSTFADPRTLAGLAWNLGLSDAKFVQQQVAGWVELIQQVRPSLLISDFGILAAAVASALGLPVARIGTGFECPPGCNPLASLSFRDQTTSHAERSLGDQVLTHLNQTLGQHGLAAFDYLGQCLGDADKQMLATVAEFDAYRDGRQNVDYLGVWDAVTGTSPVWSVQNAFRAVGYLKPFSHINELLRAIDQTGTALALVDDGLSAKQLEGTRRVTIQDGFVDWRAAAPQANFVVINGNHGSTLAALAAGLPVLACPLWIEQRVTAERIAQLNVGVVVNPRQPDSFAMAVERLLTDSSIHQAVERFAPYVNQWMSGSVRRAIELLDRWC